MEPGWATRQVSVDDAKSRTDAVLDEVARGEVAITRRGKVIAKLVSASPANRAREAVERLRALRDGIAMRGEKFSWDALQAYRDEGRR